MTPPIVRPEPRDNSARLASWTANRAASPHDSQHRPSAVRILGIAGSLRHDSYNRKLLRSAAGLVAPDAEFIDWDGLKAIPPLRRG